LDRSMWGTDQSSSLSEQGISSLTSTLRKLYLAYGNGEKKFTTTFRNKKVTSIFIDTDNFVILVPLIINDELTIDDVNFDSLPFDDDD